MELERYFNLNAKALFTEAKTKSDLLMEIARSATSSTPALEKFDPVRLHKKLMERESIGSTGFGDEIAIPHCSLDDIDTFVVGVVISKEGIDFKAMDGKPVKLFMYIIGPRKKRNEHIRILSEISKVLRIPANISALLEEKVLNLSLISFLSLAHGIKQMNLRRNILRSPFIFRIRMLLRKYLNSLRK
jgi:mannitol/fructose-specific phosphotransferase system IIA component (Ntr-type)